ncbi:MAG: formate dehydrogenase, partial [Cypionkella sp.]
MKLYLPLDSAAVALGADEIAEALVAEAKSRGLALELIRNGSRGMVFLEPLAEVETPQGRMAFGPLTLADVPGLFGDLAAHPKALGLTDDLPWMQAQTRLTFARCGIIDPLSLADYRAHGGFKGLLRA